ncbi:MAG: hypothetical protein GY792_20150, partial [Gammaproteobacteria bacterium]|nr:hypothetical protein [Gammaproteobacteria bacterium]
LDAADATEERKSETFSTVSETENEEKVAGEAVDKALPQKQAQAEERVATLFPYWY